MITKHFGLEIEQDDSLDDVEKRVERFEKYADNDERDAEYAKERLDSGSAHTTRQVNGALSTLDKKANEAAYWRDRVASSISHANFKDRPDVIVRRIKGYEKDLRSARTSFAQAQRADRQEHMKHYQRWIDHIEERIAFQKEYLDAVGGDPREKVAAIREGDIVMYNGEDCKVLSVGKVNVLIHIPSYARWSGGRRVGREELGEIIGHEDVVKPAKVSDGLKKGCQVEFVWRRGGREGTDVGTIISLGTRNVKIKVPANDTWKYYHEHFNGEYDCPRNRCKAVEA